MITEILQNSQISNKQQDDQLLSKEHQNEFIFEIKKEISSNVILKKYRIFKNHKKQVFGQMKYTNNKTYTILLSKNTSIIKRRLLQIQRRFKQKNKLLENKIIGGGCGGSKFQIEKLQKIITKDKKQKKMNKKFEADHKLYTDKKEIYGNIEDENFGQMQVEILSSIYTSDISIRSDVCFYKPKLIEMIDVYLIYLLAGFSENETLKQTEIDKLGYYIKELKKSFDMESNEQPCLDLSFYFDILDQFNSNRAGKDTQNKSQFEKVTEFISSLVKLGVNVEKAVSGDIISTIKLTLQGIDQLLETYQKQKANKLFSFLIDILRRKSIKFGDQIWLLTLEQELDFYLNQLYELICKKEQEQENELILLTLIKIDHFFNIALEEQNNREMVIQKFPLSNELIIKILPFLMQKVDSKHFLEFLSFMAQNPTYRFLAISILLKYYQIILASNDFINQKEKILIYLSYKYLCETKKNVKVAYVTNKQFVQIFNEKIKDTIFKQQILEISENRKKDLPMLESSEYKIENIKDIERMIANILIDQWERNVKKRQKENISQKDDVLLEVQDLYIQQQLTFLQGSQAFKEKLPKSISSSHIDDYKIDKQQINALGIITDIFLKDTSNEQDTQDEQMKKNQEQINCKILGILAEGGTGKSMLIKKLESHLIESSNSHDSGSENKDFIPLLIKCNTLDPKDPSIEQYLKYQGIEQIQIDSLKNSIRNKVILLDGYDEYTGEYFRVFQKLNLNSWKNTKVIVTSRREKLTLNEACFNFSLDNEKGQMNESSFCILKLEEFKDNDILDYCERYFKQYRTNEDKQFDEIQYQKDLAIIEGLIKKNKSLENLLYLPINLYLFTRMIVELKVEKEIQTIKTSITDQISIQEIFFKEQFKRETQDFIHSHIDSEKRSSENQDEIINAYFEYFQVVAMQMFLNKGKQGVVNFLQIQKNKIEFSLRKDFQNKLTNIQQKTLQDKIGKYVNSKIITRINEKSNIDKEIQNSNSQVIEFKHKSLFEYFAARAMKYDFDIYGKDIWGLPIQKLKEFKINQKSIMNIGYNQSEQQILIKLYKLIKNEIECEEFRKNYHQIEIEKNNKYIMYLKRSQIQRNTETSQIDIGASNLISALFLSKFCFSKLSLSLCSFSRAYVCNPKSNQINFDRCNIQYAYFNNSHIDLDSCNTQQANFDTYAKVFDTSNIYSFNQVVWGKNNILYGISRSGYINAFKMMNQDIQLFKSKQLSQTPLSNILFFSDEYFLVSSKQTLFLINSNSFEIKQIHKFTQSILNITAIEKSIIVTLENKNILKGTFEDGFKQLNINGSGSIYNKANQILLTYEDQEFSLWNTNKNFEFIKTINVPNFNICSIVFSADGKYLATGSSDNTFKIWNADKGFEILNTIQDHKTTSVAFSSNGKYIATGLSDNTCKIWNVEKGFELINTIQGHTLNIQSVDFSADGKYLATGSSDNTCKIWNAEKGFELVNTIQGHISWIRSVAFSANGKYLATGSDDNTCKIWNAEKGFELLNTIQGHISWIRSVAFSANGKYLATGSDDNTCKIWNAEKGFELTNTISNLTHSIYSLSFSKDGKYLATGSEDKNCKIWNVDKGFDLINTIQGHTDTICFVDFSSDGKYLATGSEDNTCKIWNAEKSFELINTIQGHTGTVYSVAFSANGKYIATGSEDNTCKIWNAEKGFELINTILGHTSQIQSVAFSEDGKHLATGSQDNTCKIWNAEKGYQLINTISGHTKTIFSVAFSSDGKYFATGSEDNTFKVWNTEKGFELINSIQGHTSDMYSVAFSSDGKYLATGSEDNTCTIWDSEKGFEFIYKIHGHADTVCSVIFSANGKYLATGSKDNTCKIWNVEKGFELINRIQSHTSWIRSVAFSSEGKYLATGSDDNTCKIWNAEQGFNIINTIQDCTYPIFCVAFSVGGKYLATGQLNNTCNIWNAEKVFERIYTLQGHTSQIRSVAFSADGKYLATGSDDKTCKIWNVEKGFELNTTIQNNLYPIFCVTFTTDGKYLSTGQPDNTCKIWNAEKGFELSNIIQGHTDTIYSVAFSADGKFLATASSDYTCKIWNAEKGIELINIISRQTKTVISKTFSADGKFLATVSDNTCKIWSAEKEYELINTIQDHKNTILSVAFSTDGKFLATILSDHTCKIWNIEKNFQLIYTFQEQISALISIQISVNCQFLSTVNVDKICTIWQFNNNFTKIESKLIVKQVCKIEFSNNNKYILVQQIDEMYKIYDLSTLKIVNELNQESLEKMKEKYLFEQIKQFDYQKMKLFENLYIL